MTALALLEKCPRQAELQQAADLAALAAASQLTGDAGACARAATAAGGAVLEGNSFLGGSTDINSIREFYGLPVYKRDGGGPVACGEPVVAVCLAARTL